MDQLAVALGAGWLALAVFLIVLAVLWLLVPFALFGIKPILRDMLTEMRRQNGTLPPEGKTTSPEPGWKQALTPASTRVIERPPQR